MIEALHAIAGLFLRAGRNFGHLADLEGAINTLIEQIPPDIRADTIEHIKKILDEYK